MFSMEDFLAAEQAKDLVRFSTAGSVDDGKSTLIGRLLYDSQNVYEDHVRAVTKAATGNVASAIDFAQLTDGLRAEREQGITIDVAYRYFSTTHRKFIIADTPGHEQYTRNMATGASTADVAIILVDARKGILTQSRRHAYIASLLGTRHIVAAVNKMDLVDYSAETFAALERDLQHLASKLGIDGLLSIPISALHGDNVVDRGTRMPWYDGPTLLEYLETVPTGRDLAGAPFRLPIQRVIRPDQHYRGFAGQIAAGSVWPGDRVVALPSGRTSRVKSITTFDGDLERAVAPMSVALTLEDELDISRGEMLAAAHQAPAVAANFLAALVWMNAEPLDLGKTYLLKHTSQTVKASIRTIQHRVNIQTLEPEQAATLELNSIGVVEVETTRPLFLDTYADQRTTGSFILIDPASHATVAAGMVREVLSGRAASDKKAVAAVAIRDPELLRQVETALGKSGVDVVRTRTANRALLQRLFQAGVTVLIEANDLDEFSGEVSLALPSTDVSFRPYPDCPASPERSLPSSCVRWRKGATNEHHPRLACSPCGTGREDRRRPQAGEPTDRSSPRGGGLRDQQLPGRRHGRSAPGAGSAGQCAGDLSRYRLPLRGDLRVSRSPDQRVGPESGECTAHPYRGGTGIAIRHSEPDCPRPLLRHAQGRSLVCVARALPPMVHRAAPGAGKDPRKPSSSRCVHFAYGKAATEDKPLGGLVDQGRMAVRGTAWHSPAVAVRKGLHQHRMRTMYQPAFRSQ